MKKRINHKHVFWVLLAFLGAVILFLPSDAGVQTGPQASWGPPDAPPVMKPSSQKIEYVLFHMYELNRTKGMAEVRKFASEMNIDMVGDSVRVEAEASGNWDGSMDNTSLVAVLKNQITALGGTVELTYDNLVQHLAPVHALIDIAELPSVRFLHCTPKPVVHAYTSEGVANTGAEQWQNMTPYRVDGDVNICIFDLGFTGYQALLGTELPSSVTTKSFRADGNLSTNVHGAACAEIVYDMAPDAMFTLANFNTLTEHHTATDWFISNNIDIVSYSIGWTNSGDGEGTGPVCEDVKKFKNAGGTWVTSAGNSREDHWEGTFYDPDNDKWHNFSGSGEINWTYGYYCYAALNWDDWGTWNGSSYSGSNQDYDLYLYYWWGGAWHYLGGSAGWQNGSQWPTEWVGGYASVPLYWGIRIRKYSATRNVKHEVFFSGNWFTPLYWVPQGSLGIPADSPDTVTVGATDAVNNAFHSYSSQGPTHDNRIKPDIMGPSGVSGNTYGTLNFYGTSASCPHVAGAFALLKGKTPFTLDQIQAILYNRAIDVAPAGKDSKYGWGRLNLKK